MSRIGDYRTRTLVCTLFAGFITVSCKPQRDDRDTSRDQRGPTGSQVVSDVTFLSARTVASGEFRDSALIKQILDTARTLTKADWDNLHDRRDERRLLKGNCSMLSKSCVPGPFARIVARKNIHKTKPSDLGKGRIVGRIINLETNASIPYEKLGLYAGTRVVYWWIGVRANPGDPSRMDTLSVYVPGDWSASKPAKWRIVGMVKTNPGNAGFTHAHSSARFVWNDRDDETWVSCVTNGCCEPPMTVMDTSQAGSRARIEDIEGP